MAEIGEMGTEDQLRNELRDVRHDRDHVAGERDEALRKLALANELLAAYEQEPASKLLSEYILANQKLAKRADQLEDLLRATVPVLAYVSSGRTHVGVEPYPDATARKVLGQIDEAIGLELKP